MTTIKSMRLMTFFETDILKKSPDLEKAIESFPMLLNQIHSDLKMDKYQSLVQHLDQLQKAAGAAQQLAQNTINQNQGKLDNKEDVQGTNRIEDEEI